MLKIIFILLCTYAPLLSSRQAARFAGILVIPAEKAMQKHWLCNSRPSHVTKGVRRAETSGSMPSYGKGVVQREKRRRKGREPPTVAQGRVACRAARAHRLPPPGRDESHEPRHAHEPPPSATQTVMSRGRPSQSTVAS